MPDINLLKNTDRYPEERKKPKPVGEHQLSQPYRIQAPPGGSKLGSVLQSIFKRGPKALPTAPPPPPPPPAPRPAPPSTVTTPSGPFAGVRGGRGDRPSKTVNQDQAEEWPAEPEAATTGVSSPMQFSKPYSPLSTPTTSSSPPVTPSTPRPTSSPSFSSLSSLSAPAAPAPTPTPGGPFAGFRRKGLGKLGKMTTEKGRSGERILSETKKAAPAVIPLPDAEEGDHRVNLLSEDLLTPDATRRHATVLGLSALGALLVVGLAYGGLLLYEQNVTKHITETKTKLEQVTQEITSLNVEQQQASATVQKLTAIQTLIDHHIRWTKFFGLMERYTMPEVTYGPTYSGSLADSVSVTATTTSFENVAKQYLIFQQLVRDKVFISDFSITGATSQIDKDGNQRVSFGIALKLLPDNLTVSAKEAAAILKAAGTTSAPTHSNP